MIVGVGVGRGIVAAVLRRIGDTHSPHEPLGLTAMLGSDMIDLLVDRLGRHLLEHPAGDPLLHRQPPDATDDDGEEQRHQGPIEPAPDEQQPGVHEGQREREEAKPDMGP